jgi:hypothetical protein
MKRMKSWNLLLIIVSVAVLPFALVGVGQAQQMTCWYLKPSQTERKREDDNYLQAFYLTTGDAEGHELDVCRSAENEEGNEEGATAPPQAG